MYMQIEFKWPIGLGRYARHALGIISGETYREPQRLKRTSVHIMPRAIPCAATCDPRYGRGRCGAFAPAGVRARKLWGLV